MVRKHLPRSHPRVPSDTPMVCREIETEDHEEWFARIRNLSLGGCMFTAPSSLDEDSLVEVRMSIHGAVAKADATVVFSNPRGRQGFETGVRFIRLLPIDRILLEDMLDGHGERRGKRQLVAGDHSRSSDEQAMN